MIQAWCKRHNRTFHKHNRFSMCPWCEEEGREIRLVVGISIAVVAAITAALWWTL